MKITINSIDNYESEATITFDAAELDKVKPRACKQLASRANFPGFRKGKVPPDQILEQYFGKGAILEESAEILIRQGANDVWKMMSNPPVTDMKPEIITCEKGQDFVFKLTYTPYPEVKIGEYKGIDVEEVAEPVTDEKIDEYINHLREHHANIIDAEEGAQVADGDFITLDFSGTVNGKKFKGGEAKDYPLEIGSHSFIDTFEDQLIGMKVGDERDVNVTFPEGYQVKDLAEKPAVFHCKINSIKHSQLPELDDAFVKKVSKFETVEEFKDDVKKNLEINAERDAVLRQREAIIQKAVDNMTVDLPPVMIDTRVEQMVADLEARLKLQGINLDVYLAGSGRTLEEIKEDYREDAKKSVLRDVLFNEVARREKIEVSEGELNIEIAIMANMYHTTPKQIAKALKDNGQFPTVISNLRQRKAMQFIIEHMGAKDDKPADDKVEDNKKVDDTAAVDEKPVDEKVDSTVDDKSVADEKVDDKKVEE